MGMITDKLLLQQNEPLVAKDAQRVWIPCGSTDLLHSFRRLPSLLGSAVQPQTFDR